MQTSGAGLMLYRASVASPMIHGPGSSMYIFASLEWTAGRAIPFQPRSSTRYLTVETAICIMHERDAYKKRGNIYPKHSRVS